MKINMFGQCDVLLSEFQSDYKDMDQKFKALHQQMSNELAKILYCLEDLGLLCAYEVLINFVTLWKKTCNKKKMKNLFYFCCL